MYGQDMAMPNKLVSLAPGQFPTSASSRMIDRPDKRYREHGARTPSDAEDKIICLETTRDGAQAFLRCCAPFYRKTGVMWGLDRSFLVAGSLPSPCPICFPIVPTHSSIPR